jgi:hypothetical protein
VRAQHNLYEDTKLFQARDYVEKWSNSLSSFSHLIIVLCTGLLYYKICTNRDIKKRELSARCLVGDLPSKTIKHTSLYNKVLFLGILHSCRRKEVAGITNDAHS